MKSKINKEEQEECRGYVWVYVNEGMTYEEIAKMLDLPVEEIRREHKEQLETQQKPSGVYEAALTLLVAAVTIIVLTLMAVDLF